MTQLLIETIISGGQTGVDRAALDVAIKLGISHGGWCPKGRKAEDGSISLKYKLQETLSSEYSERTELNIRDSDGTLVILTNTPIGGTRFTIDKLVALNKPYISIDPKLIKLDEIILWIKDNNIHKLNVAGPRVSQCHNIYCLAYNVLERLLVDPKLMIHDK